MAIDSFVSPLFLPREWFDDKMDWDGPACYELAIAGHRGGDRRQVYVGETIRRSYKPDELLRLRRTPRLPY